MPPRDSRLHMKLTYWRVIVAIGLLGSFINGCGPGRNSNERRDHPPFVLDQRMPNRPETSVMASGSPLGPISRSSEQFKTKLVRSFDTGIVFKDNEKTGADRVMTRRCKSALERLAQFVKDEWEGTVKLRVIDAWDEDQEHTPNSLHYEGRALDITTSDKDQSKYGKLASLAYYSAKFDWVAYFEGHVHVSCRADGPDDEQPHCFPSQSLVRLPNGQTKRLEDIAVGDHVLTVNQAGKFTYSEVIMFLDRQPDIEIQNYVYMETSGPSRNLSLTEKHLLYVSETSKGTSELRFARDVINGDYLSVYVPGYTTLLRAKVTSVQRKRLKGAIAPLTMEGTIIVSDFLSSCYASVEDQTFSHSTFLPWRHLYNFAGHSFSKNGQIGQHWYVYVLRTLNYLFGVYPNI